MVQGATATPAARRLAAAAHEEARLVSALTFGRIARIPSIEEPKVMPARPWAHLSTQPVQSRLRLINVDTLTPLVGWASAGCWSVPLGPLRRVGNASFLATNFQPSTFRHQNKFEGRRAPSARMPAIEFACLLEVDGFLRRLRCSQPESMMGEGDRGCVSHLACYSRSLLWLVLVLLPLGGLFVLWVAGLLVGFLKAMWPKAGWHRRTLVVFAAGDIHSAAPR